MTKRKEKDDTNTHLTENVAAVDGTTAHEEAQIDAKEPRYVKFTEVKLGDTLVGLEDHESDCIHEGDEYEVKQNERGRLFVHCDEGEHYLDKDVDVHDYIKGLAAKAV